MKAVIWIMVGALCYLGSGMLRTAAASDGLILAAGEATSPVYQVGVGLASLIKVKLSPTHKIDIKAIHSEGPVDNVRLIQQGAANLAILPSVTGYAALTATGSFAGLPPERELRAVTALWSDVLHLVVQDQDVSTGTIDDFLALKDRKVFLGRETTGADEANRLLLAGLGLDVDKAFDVAPVAKDDLIHALKQGHLDAFSLAAMTPSPLFQTMGDITSEGMKFLQITTDQVIKANGSHWLWSPYTIPAATYPGQSEDISTIAHANLLAVDADLPEEMVYQITRSIFENLAYLRRVTTPLRNLTLDRALSGLSLPLHPGAHRYFKEVGLISETNSPEQPSSDPLPYDHDQTGYPNADVA